MNTPIAPGVLTYDVSQGQRLRLFGVVRGAVADSDAAVALALLGLTQVTYYTGQLPADWPTEPTVPLAQDERLFRAEGTWSKTTAMPTATDATGGSLIFFGVWAVTTDSASTNPLRRLAAWYFEVGGGARGGTDLDAAFYPKLAAYAASLPWPVPAEWFLLVFYLESRLNPHIGNELGYVGLNQLASSQLQSQYHVSPADYLTWSASRQLEEVVGPWYRAALTQYLGRAPQTPGGLYALNLAPGRVKTQGDGPNAVMYPAGSKEANANLGLDMNKDGALTVSDFDGFMTKLASQPAYQAALAELRKYAPAPAAQGMTTGKALLWAFVVAAGAAATVAVVRRRRDGYALPARRFAEDEYVTVCTPCGPKRMRRPTRVHTSARKRSRAA